CPAYDQNLAGAEFRQLAHDVDAFAGSQFLGTAMPCTRAAVNALQIAGERDFPDNIDRDAIELVAERQPPSRTLVESSALAHLPPFRQVAFSAAAKRAFRSRSDSEVVAILPGLFLALPCDSGVEVLQRSLEVFGARTAVVLQQILADDLVGLQGVQVGAFALVADDDA